MNNNSPILIDNVIFVESFENKQKISANPIKKYKSFKTNHRSNFNKKVIKPKKSLDLLVSRSSETPLEEILIGPQDSSEVELHEAWGSDITTVNNALNQLNAKSTDISSNIKEALQDISGYTDISSTAKISKLRERVNDIQGLLKKLYTRF